MARNSGVLIRQLLGNRNHPCAGLLHHLHHKPIQNLTSVPNTAPSSQQTIDIRSASEPLSYYSLHTPNLELLQQRRYLSSPSLSDSDSNNFPTGPSNLFVIETLSTYYEVFDKVKDEHLSAVFFYTAPGCRATRKWITPIFDELREQFRHITMYKVYMDQNGPGCTLDVFGVHRRMNIAGSTLDKLGIHVTPTLHCYLKGERVDELAGASVRHLKKRLENVYNPSGMEKRRRRGKKDENDGGLVEVLPSRLPEASIQKVILELGQLIYDEVNQEDDQEYNLEYDPNQELDPYQQCDMYLKCDKMWWFAKGLVSCEKKMQSFCKLEDPKAKRDWIKSEMAKE